MNRPNHTTVVAYLALFLAIGAGTAFAAGQLAKNSVGSKQLKKNAVTGAKVKRDAITSAKVKDASLLGADLADATITGAKIADGSLSATDISGGVRASNVIGVAMTKDCGPAAPFPAGVSTTTATFGCTVHFGSSVLDCSATATPGFRTSDPVLLAARSAQIFRDPTRPNDLEVDMFFQAEPSRMAADLTLVC